MSKAVFKCPDYRSVFKAAEHALLQAALDQLGVLSTTPWQDHGQFIAEFLSKINTQHHMK